MSMPASVKRVLQRLRRSAFRSRFALTPQDRAYLQSRGGATVSRHAAAFVAARIAPAHPRRDGRQTPLRGHPVFTAQHATATCCRRCLQRWHGIPRGTPLDDRQIAYVVEMIMGWIAVQAQHPAGDALRGIGDSSTAGPAALRR
jgi:hypothetical protein